VKNKFTTDDVAELKEETTQRGNKKALCINSKVFRSSRPSEDAMITSLHSALLVIGYSSVFSPVILDRVVTKVLDLELSHFHL